MSRNTSSHSLSLYAWPRSSNTSATTANAKIQSLKKTVDCVASVFVIAANAGSEIKQRCVLSHSCVNALSVSLPLNFYETISNYSVSILSDLFWSILSVKKRTYTEDYLHSDTLQKKMAYMENLYYFKIKLSRDLARLIILGRINNFSRIWGLFLSVNIPRGNLIAVLSQWFQNYYCTNISESRIIPGDWNFFHICFCIPDLLLMTGCQTRMQCSISDIALQK